MDARAELAGIALLVCILLVTVWGPQFRCVHTKAYIDALLAEIERLKYCSIDHHYAINLTSDGGEISCRCGSLRSGTKKLEKRLEIVTRQRREAGTG